MRSLEVNYGKAHYFEKYFPPLKQMLEQHGSKEKVVDLNIALIEWFAQELGVHTPMVRATALGVEGKRSARLVSFCAQAGATDYLSPRSAGYLFGVLTIFNESCLNVWFQSYTHPEYEQRFPPFVPYASVVDLLFNQGP